MDNISINNLDIIKFVEIRNKLGEKIAIGYVEKLYNKFNSDEYNDVVYNIFVEKYSKKKVDSFFNSILDICNDKADIRNKFSDIYLYSLYKDDEDLEKHDSSDSHLVNPIRAYLNEIARYKLLTPEEEKSLFHQFDSCKEKLEIVTIDNDYVLHFNSVNDIYKIVYSTLNYDFFKLFRRASKYVDEEQKKEIDKFLNSIRANVCYSDDKPNYEEYNYFKKQLENLENYGKIREKLINSNLRLVASMAKRYVNCGMEFTDLCMEGNFGLMKAVNKFDVNMNYKFSTYASWWIRQAINRAVANLSRTIRIPVHLNDEIGKYRKAVERLSMESGIIPTDEEIAKEMNITIEKIRYYKQILELEADVSLDAPIGDEEDAFLVDFIVADNYNMDGELFNNLVAKDLFDILKNLLSERELDILLKRYGFNSEHRCYTLEEIGIEYNVTRERIRKIEAKALKKLRHPTKIRKIRDFYY